MSAEEQVRKTRQALNTVASNVTHLTNTLVSNVVESSPQLYVNTKLRVLNAIASLPEGVLELQQAWEEMHYALKQVGLAFPLEEKEEEEESEPRHRVTERTATKAFASAEKGVPKRGLKTTTTTITSPLRSIDPRPHGFPNHPRDLLRHASRRYYFARRNVLKNTSRAPGTDRVANPGFTVCIFSFGSGGAIPTCTVSSSTVTPSSMG